MKKFLKRLFKNIFEKVIAVILAIAIWTSFYEDVNAHKELKTEVSFNTDIENEVVNPSIHKVKLNIKSTKKNLILANPDDFKIHLKVPKQTKRKVISLPLNPENFIIPKKYHLLSFEPKIINKIDVDVTKVKRVSINPIYQVRDPNNPNRFIKIERIVPSGITIWGPSRLVKEIQTINTDYFTFQNLNENGIININLYVPFENLKTEVQTAKIFFKIEKKEKGSKKVKSVLKILKSPLIKSPEIKQIEISAEIIGSLEDINNIKSSDYVFFLDPLSSDPNKVRFWSQGNKLTAKKISPSIVSINTTKK